MKRDHSAAIEALAAERCLSPLALTEMFLERAAIRQYEGGMSREYAEREALRDITAELKGNR